jgi:hypothetical protein
MNIHPMMMALDQIEAAIVATIDPSHRGELTMMAYKLRLILRGHGVFIGGGIEPTLQQRACSLRRDEASLRAVISNTFPVNTPVQVNAPQYNGFWFVSRDSSPNPSVVAVMLENGNTWWYPAECCRLATWEQVDPASRRTYLRSRGIKLPAQGGPWRKLP